MSNNENYRLSEDEDVGCPWWFWPTVIVGIVGTIAAFVYFV